MNDFRYRKKSKSIKKRSKRSKRSKRRKRRKRSKRSKYDTGFLDFFKRSEIDSEYIRMSENEYIKKWNTKKDNDFKKKLTEEQNTLYNKIFTDLFFKNKISSDKEIRHTQIGFLQAIYWYRIDKNLDYSSKSIENKYDEILKRKMS
jgi:hypothetical protein